MARKLPWATVPAPHPKTSKPGVAVPRAKRQRSSSPPTKESSSTTPPLRKPKRRAASRTPSTSPPPGPPDAQPMREGYDADDIYVMVEDEFHSVAQGFTHHLHHAEYKRLQKKAREKATAVDAGGRQVFGQQGKQRAEVKKMIEAKEVGERQRRAMDGMVGTLTDGQESEAEEEVQDPWSGTSLAGLMSGSSPKRTALVGLETVSSSTRAAKGFERGDDGSPKKQLLDVFGEKGSSTLRRHGRSDGEALDGHDRTVVSKSRYLPAADRGVDRSESTAEVNSLTTRTGIKSEVSPRQERRSINTNKPQRSRGLFNGLGDFDDGFQAPSTVAVAARSTTEVVDGKSAKDHKKSRMSEVPTFLV